MTARTDLGSSGEVITQSHPVPKRARRSTQQIFSGFLENVHPPCVPIVSVVKWAGWYCYEMEEERR